MKSLLIAATVFASVLPLCAQTPAQTSAKPADRSCSVDHTPPSAGDTFIASRNYKEAEAAFRGDIQKSPSEDAHLGLVRALLGQDKIAEARAEANSILQAAPKSAIAEVAVSEAAYRAGDINAATIHATMAYQDSPCEGRAFAALADLYGIHARFARASALITVAHQLRPDDELIRREWFGSLPREKRIAEIEKYLADTHSTSPDELHGFQSQLEYLKLSKPGQCRAVSHPASTTISLMAIFGTHTKPEEYGLNTLFDGKARHMEIDTGAPGITLSKEAARALGLKPEYTSKAGGLGDEGVADTYLAHVHSIRIGDVEFADCLVEVINKKSRLSVDGLIGMDLFRKWIVTLDYQGAKMMLSPLPPRPGSTEDDSESEIPRDAYTAPDMKEWTSVLRIGHNIMLPAGLKQAGDKSSGIVQDHYLIMDTGAEESFLSLSFARSIGSVTNVESHMSGISGKVKKIYETETHSIAAANVMLPMQSYYAEDLTSLSHSIGFESSGLLGLTTLQYLTVSIDYRDNLVMLKYDPNRHRELFQSVIPYF
jgi:Flp pilus assembly protein TadD